MGLSDRFGFIVPSNTFHIFLNKKCYKVENFEDNVLLHFAQRFWVLIHMNKNFEWCVVTPGKSSFSMNVYITIDGSKNLSGICGTPFIV